MTVDKSVGAAGKAGKGGAGGQTKKKRADMSVEPLVGEGAKPKWKEGGGDIQKDLEVWVMGTMVIRVAG